MNIHYFQHVPFEGLGSIENWVDKPGNKITATRFYEDHRLPFIDLFDMLIVMGGPMGAADDHKYPWMKPEKDLIEKAIKRNKLVLGICLGAQLIADVLGAKVYPNKEKEIGWYPVQFTSSGKKSRLLGNVPDELEVFHWHGDTFDLPAGSVHLARNEACDHQAFSYNEHVLGLQFHLEVTLSSVQQFVTMGKDEIVEGRYIQREELLMGIKPSFIDFNNSLMAQILDKMKHSKNIMA
jgi:GMP synthase-like glutamine amidotransferase